ncbi:MAG: hypothetical protein E7L17_14475 [Clostridium sp.]|uniref:hypothetical protein n=1 Tax=Clostridium sp. TaxID=1506 RepID=UPI00290D32DD|nr:hypothetical protein [Clostridium sp.]MDU7339305.1 hypothetical protein [Clostridium sp.]
MAIREVDEALIKEALLLKSNNPNDFSPGLLKRRFFPLCTRVLNELMDALEQREKENSL